VTHSWFTHVQSHIQPPLLSTEKHSWAVCIQGRTLPPPCPHGVTRVPAQGDKGALVRQQYVRAPATAPARAVHRCM